jgi:hypothetical protein
MTSLTLQDITQICATVAKIHGYHVIKLFPDKYEASALIWYREIKSDCFHVFRHIKKAAVPLQVWSGPEGSRKLRFPDFMTMAQDGGKAVSLMHQPPLPPGNTPGTHFCQRLSRLQGHSATGRIMSLKDFNETIGNRTRDLTACSVVP